MKPGVNGFLRERRHSLGSRLSFYIAKEFLFSLLVAFLFFFFLFFVNQLLVIARDVLSKRVDIMKTLLLIIYAMPAIIALAVPFSSLVGCIMAVGRFSSDNEIVAFQACGINLLQVFLPILIIALMLAAFSFIVNDIFLPLGTVNYIKLYQELIYSNSELILEPYSITRFNNTTIISTSVHQGVLGPVVLIDVDEEGRKRVINAASGRLVPNTKQLGVITLELDGVGVMQISQKSNDFDAFHSDNILYNMLLKTLSDSLHNPGPREMSSVDLRDNIKRMELKQLDQLKTANMGAFLAAQELGRLVVRYADERVTNHVAYPAVADEAAPLLKKAAAARQVFRNDRVLQLYWIEFWKKFSIPAACFSLIFLGFPAGIFARRSGRSIGFGVGFVIAVIFWTMITAGQALGTDNPDLSPLLLMWAPNLFFFGIGVYLLARRILR